MLKAVAQFSNDDSNETDYEIEEAINCENDTSMENIIFYNTHS